MTTAAATEPGTRRPLWRLHALVVGMTLAAAGCFALAILMPGGALEAPAVWRLALATLVLLVGESTVLHLRFGRDTYTFTWSEAAIIVGLFLVPWPWLSILSPIAVAAVHAIARRSPVKVLFNGASWAVAATLAQATALALTGGHSIHDVGPLLGCTALTAAACACFAWNGLSVSAAIAFSRGLPVWEVAREGLTLKLAVLAGNTIVALLLVTAQWQGSTVVLIPFSFALLYLAYRGYLRALEERDVWRQLDRTAKEISLLDERGVAVAAVERAAELFKADVAELAVAPSGDGPVQVFVRHEDGTQSTREESWHRTGSDATENLAFQVISAADTTISWIATPLEDVHGLTGWLRLGFPAPTELSARQQKVLRTFLHSVCTSLQNARLYDEMRHLAELYAQEARHDPLTGLANRKFFYERAVAELSRSQRDNSHLGLLLIDLDHFKEINDTLGHGAGDELLRTVAGRLKETLRGSDVVARLGGDEFAVLLCDLPSPEVSDQVAEDMLRVLAEPIDYDGLRMSVEGSIGIAVYPHDGTTVEDLLRHADVAMYQAKETRGAFARYRRDKDESNVNRMTLVADLRNAINANEFAIMFQPQVNLATGEVVGAEVLTRWQHPKRGLLRPDEFINAAENSGLMQEFTYHIMDHAVAECAYWFEHEAVAHVAVNLSARNLLDPRLAADVAEILARRGLPAERLVLEITETTMVSDIETVQQVLAELRRIGVELSVDDFGTGYSSLALLQRIAVNEIKIDRSFVQAMLTSDGDAAIVRATVELAHGLGLRVVAEGVETADHVDALRELRCDVAQGWHFGRPADGAQMRQLLGLQRTWVPGVRRSAATRHLRVAGGSSVVAGTPRKGIQEPAPDDRDSRRRSIT
jgi:diguanylate cyclase (GGDEF)-like protein